MSIVLALLAAGLTAPAVASAASATPARDPRAGHRESVTLMLAAPDPAGLQALARAHHVSKRDRVQRLHSLRPSAAQQATVADRVRALGLDVVGQTTWTVTATGPAAKVDGLFGSARAVRSHNRFASTLPRRPGALAGLVTAAFGGDDPRPVAQPLSARPASGPGLGGGSAAAIPTPNAAPRDIGAGLDGPAIRAAYSAPTGAPLTGRPNLAVATVQLSGWDDSDLTAYAPSVYSDSTYDPVTSGQYTPVSVDGADPSAPDGNGGDMEVALDQESLLGTAPYADQRAYVAPNSYGGFVDAVAQVATDATDAAHDYYNLAALSISWGSCEPAWSSDALNAMDTVLADAVASGVTVFAASGDAGAFDCDRPNAPDNHLTVDYPASDPSVVAVGGTHLDPAGPTDTVWATPDTNPATAYLGSGGGGGESGVFATPPYQSSVAARLNTSGRLVPDISADADPATGFGIVYHGSPTVVGGTSLASPLSAAMLTDDLATVGTSWGIGDIHENLYAAPSGAFRDVVSGDNLYYAAGPGYDEASGLGAPLWNTVATSITGDPQLGLPAYSRTTVVPLAITAPAPMGYRTWRRGVFTSTPPDYSQVSCPDPSASPVAKPTTATVTGDGPHTLWVTAIGTDQYCGFAQATTFVDSRAPVARATAGLATPTAPGLTFRWSATDAAPSSGLVNYDVVISHVGGTVPDYRATTTLTSRAFTGLQGRTYLATVRARDRAGNVSPPAVATVVVPIDDRLFAFGAGWSHTANVGDFLGTVSSSALRNTTASRAAVGRSYTVWLNTGPALGRALLLVNGVAVRTVDLYAPVAHTRVPFLVAGYPTDANRTIGVRVLGVKAPASRGYAVSVDALSALS